MQKRVAVVNDLSGFGRCSAAAALPILSAMGVQCGIVPTAILSNQTEYPLYTMLDFTDHLPQYLDTWKSLGFTFDCIYTGFLGSAKQIDIIAKMIKDFDIKERIIDPVMGDHGKIYDSYTPALCNRMKELAMHATVITPNVTELAILTDTPYKDDFSDEDILSMCKVLDSQGISRVIVTGHEINANGEDSIQNLIFDRGQFSSVVTQKQLPLRPGTGDVFASIITGSILNGESLFDATKKAADFITHCLIESSKNDVPINDGVCFETQLWRLCTKEKRKS